MSQILKAKTIQETVGTINVESDYKIVYNGQTGNDIVCKDGKKSTAGCLNCLNPRCMYLAKDEIENDRFTDISHDVSLAVCPADAISLDKKQISINASKCIGCGLCVARCNFGAIYLKDNKAVVAPAKSSFITVKKITDSSKHEHESFVEKNRSIRKEGCICWESDTVLNTLNNSIAKLSQEQQNVLARNILITLGADSTLARKGNVYTRMDGFYCTPKQFGVVEVETGTEMLDVSRALLDDVAVVNVRYGIPQKDNHPLAICLTLPNKRTDYWQVLKDIKNVVGMKINTVTFGALLILVWNFRRIDDFDGFYIDVDNSSIRKETERLLGRRTKVTAGGEGILENSK